VTDWYQKLDMRCIKLFTFFSKYTSVTFNVFELCTFCRKLVASRSLSHHLDTASIPCVCIASQQTSHFLAYWHGADS